MNVNNSINIKNLFMYKNIKINEISITNKSNNIQNNLPDDGVILELSSPRLKLENVRTLDSSAEIYFGYGRMLMTAGGNNLSCESRMMSMIEKYYSLDEELKEKYADNEEEYSRYKAFLDKAFDVHSSGLIYNAAEHLTYPLRWLGLRTSDAAKRDEIAQLQKEYINSIQSDIKNMFKNMKNYYDLNKSFDGITNHIISENCTVMNYSDIDYIRNLNKETQIDDKIKYGYELMDKDKDLNSENLDEIKSIFNDIKSIIDNMNCSNIFKDIYRQLLNKLQEKIANRK